MSLLLPQERELWQKVFNEVFPAPDPELAEYEFQWCGIEDCDGDAHEGWPRKHARKKQIPPDWNWIVWLLLAGRGWGKSRTGAEWLKSQALAQPGTRWFIAAPTFGDARDICVEGESGLLSVVPPKLLKRYNRSLGEVVFTNDSRVKLFSGDEPERFRGPQHHGGWFDELAAFRYGQEAWDQAMFGLRLGDHPQVVVTTTPKPTPLIRDLIERETVHVTRGSTFENRVNLAGSALAEFEKLKGTRLGRQELDAEILLDVPGAIATIDQLDRCRVNVHPDLIKRVCIVDPAVTNTESSDHTGISLMGRSVTDHVYLLEDLALKEDVQDWALAAVTMAVKGFAGTLLYESNQGGDSIAVVLQQALDRYNAAVGRNHFLDIEPVAAKQSKYDRALPLQQAIQQSTFHPVGFHPVFEQQATTWVPVNEKGKQMPSPNNLDTVVHGYRWLMDIHDVVASTYQYKKLRRGR